MLLRYFGILGFTVVALCHVKALPTDTEKDFRDFFGKTFDLALSAGKIPNRNIGTVSNYCIRKLVTAKKWLDPAYNLVLNPTNIDITHVDCDQILDSIITNGQKKMVEKFVSKGYKDKENIKCFEDKLEKNEYLGRTMVLPVLTEVKLTDAQKATEREHYIDLMVEAIDNVTECSQIQIN